MGEAGWLDKGLKHSSCTGRNGSGGVGLTRKKKMVIHSLFYRYLKC